MTTPRPLLAAASCALALAACGGGAGSGASTAGAVTAPPSPDQVAAHYRQALRFSQCMRSHGLPNFPDPSSGGGIKLQSGSGLNPFSPAFKSAQAACQKLLPGGGPGRGPASPQARKQMLAVSACMRAHGVSGFPDPTTKPPTNVGLASLALGHDGVFLVVPSTIDIRSPAFKRAAAACHFGGVPPGR